MFLCPFETAVSAAIPTSQSRRGCGGEISPRHEWELWQIQNGFVVATWSKTLWQSGLICPKLNKNKKSYIVECFLRLLSVTFRFRGPFAQRDETLDDWFSLT